MTTAIAADLARLLRQGPFLDAAQQAELPRLQASAGGPQKLVEELVRRGWLTSFQAEKLLAGHGGELVLGPYLLFDQLGQGGMGAVYRARHLVMNRLVALKVIRPEHLGNAETVGRFQREIQAVAKLQHPHIVLAHDAGKVGDIHFLAMELLDGVTLSRLVQQRGGLPVGEACAYTRQAALALQHAHEQGMVHRDVKPTNLMLTKSGVVKLLDLGLARPLAAGADQPGDDLTHTNAFMGTPDFLAPEQANDARSADIRADIYSLGCTLYFLLTAKPPFPGGTLTQKLRRHEESEPPSIAALRDDVPPALAAVLHRMMAKKPRDRFVEPGEVADALAPYCGADAGFASGQAPRGKLGNQESTATQARRKKASLVDGPATYPERGFTLEPETPPTIPSQLRDTTMRHPPPSRRSLMFAAAAGGLALLIVLAIVFWPRGQGEDVVATGKDLKKDKDGKEPEAVKGKVKDKDGAKENPKNDDPVPVKPPPGEPGPRKIWVLREDGKPTVLEFVTKLGIKKKVTVVSTNVQAGLAQTAAGSARSANPKRKGRGLEVTLELGPSTFLVVPLGLVQTIRSKDKQQTIHLLDGSIHSGTVRTTVRDDTGNDYDLGSVAEATLVQAPAAQQEEMDSASLRLTILPPLPLGYNVFSPKLHTGPIERKGKGGPSESFELKVDGDNVQGNLSEFDKVTVHREANWMMTLRLPGGKEQTGQMQIGATGWWWLGAETDSGAVLVLRGQTGDGRFEDHPGFTLERGQGAGPGAADPAIKKGDLALHGKAGPQWYWALKKDDTPIVLNVTTKLGIKATITVKHATTRDSRAKGAGVQMVSPYSLEPGVPLLSMDLGQSNFLLMPLGLVQSITGQDKTSSVLLRDGTTYSGKVLTVISVVEDNKTYELGAVAEARIVQAPGAQQRAADKPSVMLTLATPARVQIPVFAPRINNDSNYNETFKMKMDGETVQGSLSDFDRVHVSKKGTDWLVTLRLPEGKDKTGTLLMPGNSWSLIAHTPSGAYLWLAALRDDPSYAPHSGFTIENNKKQ